jgi:creatinine amidohydrolase
MRFGDRSWVELGEEIEAGGRVVIIPLGTTEAHGPGLPVDVDAHIVRHVAEAVGERTGALVAPALPYGYSSTWLHYPGTISLRAETLHEVLLDMLDSLIGQGFRRILLLNGHRHNYSVMETVARTAMDRHGPSHDDLLIATGSYWEMARDDINALRRSEFGGMAHACELETSLELAIRPELVDEQAIAGADRQIAAWDAGAVQPSMLVWRPWLRPNRNSGIVGDPTLASAESGRAFLEAIVARVGEQVERLARGESIDYYTQAAAPDETRSR